MPDLIIMLVLAAVIYLTGFVSGSLAAMEQADRKRR